MNGAEIATAIDATPGAAEEPTVVTEFLEIIIELGREIDGIEESLPAVVEMLRRRMRMLEETLRRERNFYIAQGAMAAMLETVRGGQRRAG